MPQTSDVEKRNRLNKKQRKRNKQWKEKIKSARNDFEDALANDEDEETLNELRNDVVGLLDRSVNKGVFHENKASRLKSQIDSQLNEAVNPD